MHRLKSLLVIALVSAFAASAPAASASTELFDFASSLEHTTLGGAQVGTSQFTFDAGTVSCKSGEYTGTVLESEVGEVALSPAFKECTMAGSNATVTMNGCQILLTPTAIEGASKEANEALSCGAEKSMSIVAVVAGVKCTINLPAQDLGHVAISEVTGSDLTVAAELTALEYSQTGTPFKPCQSGEGKTNGTFKHHVTINGGEAALALNPIPERVKFLVKEITFKALNEEIEFEVEAQENKTVKVLGFLHNSDFTKMKSVKNGCMDGANGTFAKKGEKCKERIECFKKSGLALELGVLTNPIGGSVIDVKGC